MALDVLSLGVHSIERSAQEDSLLVLFNTAISNLVRRTAPYVLIDTTLTASLTGMLGSLPQ
jgi:hypothetical protein